MTFSHSVFSLLLFLSDEVIRRRLVIDGDGSGDDRKIQTLLKSFLTMCSSEEFNQAEEYAYTYEHRLFNTQNQPP